MKSVVVVDEEKRKEIDVDEEDLDSEWKEVDFGNFYNIIGDVFEIESEKEVQYKEKDQEEVYIGRIYRKFIVLLLIFVLKCKELFVFFFGVFVCLKICRFLSLFSILVMQIEKKV